MIEAIRSGWDAKNKIIWPKTPNFHSKKTVIYFNLCLFLPGHKYSEVNTLLAVHLDFSHNTLFFFCP